MKSCLPEPCELLPWDSKFFGLDIARVIHDHLTENLCLEIDRWCAERHIRCLYFLARPNDDLTVTLAEQSDYHLADVRLTLERSAIAAPPPVTPLSDPIRTATAQDIPSLKAIARRSHTDTRFFFDAHFPRERCEALYETWIEASMNGFADVVLVADIGGEIAGYVTCRLSADCAQGSIGLIAVDARHQGKGLGAELVRAAIDWCQGQQVTRMTVVTQGRNIAAQRLYGRCGFITRNFELYYHRWFPLPAGATGSPQ